MWPNKILTRSKDQRMKTLLENSTKENDFILTTNFQRRISLPIPRGTNKENLVSLGNSGSIIVTPQTLSTVSLNEKQFANPGIIKTIYQNRLILWKFFGGDRGRWWTNGRTSRFFLRNPRLVLGTENISKYCRQRFWTCKGILTLPCNWASHFAKIAILYYELRGEWGKKINANNS